MEERKNGSKKRGILFRLLTIVLVFLLMSLIYVGTVLLQLPGDTEENSFVVQEEQEPVTRMQAADMNDARALAQLFGAPLPMLPGLSVNGQGSNTTHDGETVRMAVLRYEGLVITAVRPASAAPLLLHDDLSVSLRSDVTVLNMPGTLASKGERHCVYLTSENAAYSLYAAQGTEDEFLALLQRLVWAD